jgi:integrase
MASVDDRWFVQRKYPSGRTRTVPSARHGTGMRWVVRWRDADGRPRKKSFDRKSDADRAASEIETELARGTYIDPDAGTIRFRDFAEQWRQSYFDDPATGYLMGVRMRLHVYPVLGHHRLRAITPSIIRQWLHGLTVARSYQRTLFCNVSQVLNAAVADDLIGKNPCQSGTVRKPVADPHTVEAWPADWVAGVRAALPEHYAIVATLAAGTGLRQGEILALSPDDIDLDAGTIRVRRQIKLAPTNQAYFALPKARKTRVVPMAPSVRDTRAAYLEQFPARAVTLAWDRPDGALITVRLALTTRESNAVNRHYFNAKIWKPALRAAGIPATRENGCHALRHYYASILFDGGESIRTVSERLGHADPAFTLRTYTHLMPASTGRTMDITDAAFRAMPARPATPTTPRRGHSPQR